MLESIQVIIPALDEEETIGPVIETLRGLGLSRVRVVDNGSTDHTADKAMVAGAEVIREPVRGYGQACWRGYQDLPDEIEWILFCDADGSDDLRDIERLVAEVGDGADFVVGNRRVSARARGAMTPVQQFGNGLATTLIRWGWGHAYGDLGPLRLIRRDLLERIAMQDRGFGWTLEMQVRAVEVGACIVEIPVGYRPRGGGRSKISGTVRGSVAAGTIILATLGRLGWQRWNRHSQGYRWGGALVLAGAALMMPYGEFAVPGTVPWFWLAAGVMSLGWLLAGSPGRISLGWFWTVTVLARLLLLPMAPGDDVWRYLWEGQIQVAGFSPYLSAPSAPELAAWRTPTWSLINHPDATAIYPPIAQGVLHGAALLGGGVLGLKFIFLVADLAVVALLARRFGAGPAIFYAWNPLILYVGVGGAHYEPLLVLAMVAGWMAWDRLIQNRRPADGYAAALGLGVAAGLKWITLPLLAWGIWQQWRRGHRRLALGMVVVGTLPVGLALAWFWWSYGAVGSLAPGTFVREARTSELFPELLAQVWPASAYRNEVLMWFFAPVAAAVFLRTRTMVRFAENFLVALLVFAPSVHFWYFAWLIPWAVQTRNLGVRAVSVSGFVYFGLWHQLATTGQWTQSATEKILLWFPLLVGYGWSVRQRRPLS